MVSFVIGASEFYTALNLGTVQINSYDVVYFSSCIVL